MALLRKLFNKKRPEGLLEISERVFVFRYCFTTNLLDNDEYKIYIKGIVGRLHDMFPQASYMVFDFREGLEQTLIASILSEYDMTVVDYPRHYFNCPLLALETIYHFLKSTDSWLSLGNHHMLLMNCEQGGWPVLAFMLSCLMIYRKQNTEEQRTLDLIYKHAPNEFLPQISPVNPIPSQVRYLQYVSKGNISQWVSLDQPFTLDCVILRVIPDFDGEGGCRPVFRIYGQDPSMVDNRTPKVLFSSPKKSKFVRHFKQADCELVKIDIRCYIQGDVVIECVSLDADLEGEKMMFRVMFNTAFIKSNILMLSRDDIDMLWNCKDRFSKEFSAEVLFSDMDAADDVSNEVNGFEEKDGLPMEAFARVQEFFSNVDWLGTKTDVALDILQQIVTSSVLQEKLEASSPLRVGKGKTLQKLENHITEPTLEASENNSQSPGAKAVLKQSMPTVTVSADVNSAGDKVEPQEEQVADQPSAQSKVISHCSAQPEVGISTLLPDHGASNGEEVIQQPKVSMPIATPPPPPHPPSGTSSVVNDSSAVPSSTPVPPPPPPLSAPPPPPPPSLPASSASAPPPPPPPPITSSAPGPPPPPPSINSAPLPPGMSSGPGPPPPPPGMSSGPGPPPPPPGMSSGPGPPPPPPPGMSSGPGPPPPPPPGMSSGPGPPPPPPPGGTSSGPGPPPPPPPGGTHSGPGPPPPPAPGGGPPPPPAPGGGPPPPPGKGGPPGPPAAPALTRGKAISRSNAMNQTKKSNLKPYHWLKLTRAAQGSLWDETQKAGSNAPPIDMAELENLFSVAPAAGAKASKPKAPKVEVVQLIDMRRAYNCEIMLSKFKMPLPAMVDAVLALDDQALDSDQVDNLIKFCPTKEEMETLSNYTGDKEKLGKCELFFLELMRVPRVEAKLKVFSFKMQFMSQAFDLRNNLTVVNSAAQEVKDSVKLKRVMKTILSLGNALNFGTARGNAVGFKLDSLPKLTDTRAKTGRMTLMHYLCKVIAEKLPELLELPKDLVNLEAATKVQLKFLAEEMQSISKGLEKVVQELKNSENDGPISEEFCKIIQSLRSFLGFAEGEVSSLASIYAAVGRNADGLAVYFGEDPARYPFEQVVATLLAFARTYERAHQENLKEAEAEKKKAIKEAQEKKKNDAIEAEKKKKEAIEAEKLKKSEAAKDAEKGANDEPAKDGETDKTKKGANDEPAFDGETDKTKKGANDEPAKDAETDKTKKGANDEPTKDDETDKMKKGANDEAAKDAETEKMKKGSNDEAAQDK